MPPSLSDGIRHRKLSKSLPLILGRSDLELSCNFCADITQEGGENHDDSGSSGSHVYRDNSSTGDETFSGPVPRGKHTNTP